MNRTTALSLVRPTPKKRVWGISVQNFERCWNVCSSNEISPCHISDVSQTSITNVHIDERRWCTATQLGYSSVKPCQEGAIKAFVLGRDIFVSLPTGYGKSFCYCSLSLVFDILRGKQSPFHVIIVISPLLALMKDQVKKLSDSNIVAVQIQDKFDTCDDAVKARISTVCSLIFTSPELILGDKSWLDVFRSPVFLSILTDW